MQNWLLAILFIFSFYAFSQQEKDSLSVDYKKEKLSKNQIKALFGSLSQDGNHSAVTGGEGTEELTVQSARLVYVRKVSDNQKWIIKPGLDNVSSASTDNIDFVVSSASAHDYRAQLGIGVNFTDSIDTNAFGINISASLESDYLSRGIGVDYRKKNKFGGISQLKANFYWDELRWGLINVGILDFKTMVYPFELRDSSWFNISHRNTLTLSGKHSFITSVRSRLGLIMDLTFQQGILSTPFHRTYFSDGSLRVEKLPFQRLKIPLSIQYNYFLGSGFLLKNYLRYSWDSFGISSYTYKLQTPVKLNYWMWLKPFVRIYTQDGSPYFQPYAEHDISNDYYTSDYDLGDFWAYNYGVSFRLKKKANWKTLNGLEWLIESYNREDGLSFWQTSFMIDFSF